MKFSEKGVAYFEYESENSIIETELSSDFLSDD